MKVIARSRHLLRIAAVVAASSAAMWGLTPIFASESASKSATTAAAIRNIHGKVIYVPTKALTVEDAILEAYNANVDLSGADFSGLSLKNLSMPFERWVKLAGADFSRCTISNCDLHADLHGAKFTNATLVEVKLCGDLMSTDFRSVNKNSSDRGTGLNCPSTENLSDKNVHAISQLNRGADLYLSGSFNDADFTNANLAGASIGGKNFSRAKFIRTNLSNSTFNGAVLTKADFTNAIVKNTRIFSGVLMGTKFDKGALASISMISCLGTYCSPTHSPSWRATVRTSGTPKGLIQIRSTDNKVLFECKANSKEEALAKACEKHANLEKADLSFCQTRLPIKFSGMNLSRADFTGANFPNVQFSCCNLAGAKFLNTEMFADHTSIPSKNVDSVLMDGCNLRQATLTGVDCRARIFTNCDLTEAKVNASSMIQTQFQNCKLDKTKIAATTLMGSRFDNSDLRDTTITACTLSTDSLQTISDSNYKLTDVDWSNIAAARNGMLGYVTASAP